ncbi:(2Fe-2S)-binding protein [Massilia niastensis]|uniref:(2Fe-2S)-binding protein n=1 Tax=Massilia niastensis TaxID=544911 RepID=UPI000382A30C|nr:(2Fe-2S)-binding protein [Massilia niastensis]
MTGRFIRLAETGRPTINFTIDGRPAQALAGDTLLVAVLGAARSVRSSEFGDGKRAGFCLMGACQDCWVWTAEGQRLRACSTPVEEGMRIVTEDTEAAWFSLAS